MSTTLPKARRKGRGNRMAVAALVAVATILVGIVVYLVSTGGPFSSAPTSDAERDYQLLVEGLEKSPNDPAVLMTLAETEFQLGRKADAVEHGKKAVARAKGQQGYRTRFATILVQMGRRDEARTALAEELKLKVESNPEPYFLLAQIEREEKNWDAAKKNMQQGLKIDPMAADMRIVYGDILAEAGEKKAAIAQYQTALKFLPGDDRAVSALAALGVKVDKSAEATSPHGTPATN